MPTEKQIIELAHSIWEQEGRPEGKDLEHYFSAKKILEEQEAANPIQLTPPSVPIELETPPPKVELAPITQPVKLAPAVPKKRRKSSPRKKK